jgi:pimeloyl-ACP methyl ester carboxylesterase
MPTDSAAKNKLIPIIRKVINTSYRVSPKLAGRLCYRVLTTPPKHEAKPIEEAFIAEGISNYITVGKVRAAVYNWRGNGKNVLLAHGWDSYSGRWHELGRRLLAAGCNVFAIDAPGHGRTNSGTFSVAHYAELLAAFATQCQPDLIVGHSAGGMAAIYYHKAFPEAFLPSKMALLGTPARLSDFVESFRRIIGLHHEVIDALEKDFLRRWSNPFSYYSMDTFAEILDIPGLIVHDKHDDIAPYEGAYQIAANWPQAELIITEGMGHGLQTELVWEKVLELV